MVQRARSLAAGVPARRPVSAAYAAFNRLDSPDASSPSPRKNTAWHCLSLHRTTGRNSSYRPTLINQ